MGTTVGKMGTTVGKMGTTVGKMGTTVVRVVKMGMAVGKMAVKGIRGELGIVMEKIVEKGRRESVMDWRLCFV
jgi:hypothetical protein